MAQQDKDITAVTKNTYMSIGLFITMVTALVYAEHRITTIEMNIHKVDEVRENYVPRKEYESNFNSFQNQLDRIESKLDKITQP